MTPHRFLFAASVVLLATACAQKDAPPGAPTAWETANPVVPLPPIPNGVQGDYANVGFAMTPEKVRLGRWLFYDGRLSKDGTVPCAACHRPDHAFSEPTPVSTGIKGQKGGRKAPTFLNGAWPFFPVYFWDGRAASLIEQAKGPIQNPIEMGHTHAEVVVGLDKIPGYKKVFREVFGDDKITIDRIAEAIAAYEVTRMSGDSLHDQNKLTGKAAQGKELFFNKAMCAQCHAGWNFTDSKFHNLGIGWDDKTQKFADEGRSKISGKKEDTGAFKTPTLRDVSKHAPYMHDGSLATLKDVVEHYNKGGNKNPFLSEKVQKLNLTADEVDAIVEFMRALDGKGYQDQKPTAFPQ